MEFAQRILKNPLFVIGNTFLAIAIAALIPMLRTKVGMSNLLIGIGVVFFLYLLNVIIVSRLATIKHQEALEANIEKLDKAVSSNNLNWMVNQRYLGIIGSQSCETWTFAPELNVALDPDSPILKARQRNLANGSKYIYFMPDRPRTHKIIADYLRLHDLNDPEQVKFFLIPSNEFLFHTIITVYNVGTTDEKAIEYLPIGSPDVWVEMDNLHTKRMIGIGEMFMKQLESIHVSEEEIKQQKPNKAKVQKASRPIASSAKKVNTTKKSDKS